MKFQNNRNLKFHIKRVPPAYKTFMIAAKEKLEKLIAKSPDVAGDIDPFSIDKILNGLDAASESI